MLKTSVFHFPLNFIEIPVKFIELWKIWHFVAFLIDFDQHLGAQHQNAGQNTQLMLPENQIHRYF